MRHLKAAFVAIAFFVACTGSAGAAAIIARAEAGAAESSINACGGAGKAVIDCVGRALDGFAGGLRRGDISQVAPQASPIVAQAASGLRAAAAKPAALSVLNRASAALRAQAAKGAGETAEVYRAASGVIARAIAAISK